MTCRAGHAKQESYTLSFGAQGPLVSAVPHAHWCHQYKPTRLHPTLHLGPLTKCLYPVVTLQAAAITEAKLKMSDVSTALLLCSAIHQRYVDFAPALMENWHKVLLNKKDDKVHWKIRLSIIQIHKHVS